MSRITDIVSSLASPIVTAEGCTLWDVEYVKEAGTWYLRLFIDKDGGVSIEDCERISRAIDPVLDENDPIPESYVFEVGSAGSNRTLKRQSDFDRYIGSDIDVKLYSPINGAKTFTGKLLSRNDSSLSIEYNSETLSFDGKNVSSVRLHDDFEF